MKERGKKRNRFNPETKTLQDKCTGDGWVRKTEQFGKSSRTN
jgi:hypothetical protein